MPEINIDAHYTDNMKLNKPVITPVDVSHNFINNTRVFDNANADKKMQQLNNDIYNGARKERKEHGFNKKLFLEIFGGISIITILAAIIHRFKK